MRQLEITCDRCGQSLKVPIPGHMKYTENGQGYMVPEKEYDLCLECVVKFRKWMAKIG